MVSFCLIDKYFLQCHYFTFFAITSISKNEDEATKIMPVKM